MRRMKFAVTALVALAAACRGFVVPIPTRTRASAVASPASVQLFAAPRFTRAVMTAASAAQTAFVSAMEQGRVDEAIGMVTNWETDLDITQAQAEAMLNAVPTLAAENAKRMSSINMTEPLRDTEAEDNRFQQTTAKLYERLAGRGLLRGFGSVMGGPLSENTGPEVSWPNRGSIITAEGLFALTGLEQAALTPGRSNQIWGIAGALVFLAEMTVSNAMGVQNPLDTVVPVTLVLAAVDRLLLRGAVSESAVRALFPQYRQKVVRHEAAHMLVAYLLGCPIESCVLSAWEALKQPRFASSAVAGTVFFDPVLLRQTQSGALNRCTLDRYAVIVMAGIAAEALEYGKAEGGASDEEALIGFFTSIQPPWDLNRIRDQGRWGVTQAVLLLREHAEAFEALVAALDKGLPLGACIVTLEGKLPPRLPADVRRQINAAQRDGLESMLE